jgi:hypothetical protein
MEVQVNNNSSIKIVRDLMGYKEQVWVILMELQYCHQGVRYRLQNNPIYLQPMEAHRQALKMLHSNTKFPINILNTHKIGLDKTEVRMRTIQPQLLQGRIALPKSRFNYHQVLN